MFVKESPLSFTAKPFNLIGKEWMLITAGKENDYNTMTASWGNLGFLWNKPVATIYLRPQRYTKEFVDKNERFTLSFFGSSHREALSFCGSHSGRDVDKAKETGLAPILLDQQVAFEQAKLVMICKKLYRQDMAPDCFLHRDLLAENYPNHDLHTIYIGEIEAIYKQG